MKTLRHVFLAFWCALVCLPGAAFVGRRAFGFPGWAPFPKGVENRRPAPFPHRGTTSLRRFGADLSAWYDDAFAWRTEILSFYRDFSFRVLRNPVGRQVPGRGNWVFRRGGDWAELDDWLGAFRLSDAELEQWRTLFEGRREWARAHGAAYVQLVTSVKAQVRPDRMLPLLRARRGLCAADQVRAALAGSPAERAVGAGKARGRKARIPFPDLPPGPQTAPPPAPSP